MDAILKSLDTIHLEVIAKEGVIKDLQPHLFKPWTASDVSRDTRNATLGLDSVRMQMHSGHTSSRLDCKWDGAPDMDDGTVAMAMRTIANRILNEMPPKLSISRLLRGQALIETAKAGTPTIVCCHATAWTPSHVQEMFVDEDEGVFEPVGPRRVVDPVAPPCLRVHVVRTTISHLNVDTLRLDVQPLNIWTGRDHELSPVEAMRLIGEANAAIEANRT